MIDDEESRRRNRDEKDPRVVPADREDARASGPELPRDTPTMRPTQDTETLAKSPVLD